jgi:hypothetical protein
MQTFEVSAHPKKKKALCEISNFGLRLKCKDRDRFFAPDFSDKEKSEYVTIYLRLELNTEPLHIKLRPSFWKSCMHLDHKEVGALLAKNHVLNWPHKKPPKLTIGKLKKGVFEVISEPRAQF